MAGIGLEVRRGKFLTLPGPSDSCKTKLLMMIAGFQDATAGDILPGGQPITATPAEKRNFGMVFQGYALSVRHRPKAEIVARVAEMLELVQLQGLEDRPACPVFGRPATAEGAGAGAGLLTPGPFAGRTAAGFGPQAAHSAGAVEGPAPAVRHNLCPCHP